MRPNSYDPQSVMPRTVPASVSNHLAQRRAVQALKVRTREIDQARRENRAPAFTPVEVNGCHYYALPHELLLLRAGRTPDELGLEPVDEAH